MPPVLPGGSRVLAMAGHCHGAGQVPGGSNVAGGPDTEAHRRVTVVTSTGVSPLQPHEDPAVGSAPDDEPAGWLGDPEEDILRGYKLHANAYVTKPVDVYQFITAVRQIDDFLVSVVRLPRLLPNGPMP